MFVKAWFTVGINFFPDASTRKLSNSFLCHNIILPKKEYKKNSQQRTVVLLAIAALE